MAATEPPPSDSQGLIRLTRNEIRRLIPADLGAVVELSLLGWEPAFVSFESILGTPIFERIYRPDPRTAQAANVTETCLADEVEAFVAVTADDVVACCRSSTTARRRRDR
jgi:hypothetical protein